MTTTRSQARKVEGTDQEGLEDKRESPREIKKEEPPTKKPKTERDTDEELYFTGTIERGHIYFFYRPKVQLEEAESIDDVRNFHMLLVPRRPEFMAHESKTDKLDNENDDKAGMKVLEPGADAIPEKEKLGEARKHYRLVTIGKKHLPDPEPGGVGKGRKETFWATVTAVGDDLHSLEQSLGEKTYETKTRGTRHSEPVRFAARGAYAIVNNDTPVPSKRATHFGYHISHPSDVGVVQTELGIGKAASFVLQVKNPLVPATGPRQVQAGAGAEYPNSILRQVFGKGGEKGRESYGLRFARCETPELLDYKGAQLLLIAVRGGEEGLETSLGGGRGHALQKPEEEEGKESIETLSRSSMQMYLPSRRNHSRASGFDFILESGWLAAPSVCVISEC